MQMKIREDVLQKRQVMYYVGRAGRGFVELPRDGKLLNKESQFESVLWATFHSRPSVVATLTLQLHFSDFFR